MNIQSLKLKGFTGIKKGLGLDEVTIDLSRMSGLIALSGPTGIGKTTIMENLQPFPMLVSRPEKALKNHVYTRDATKELSFTHIGSLYETLVKIDAESGRSEGFIVKDGNPEINGKITDYKDYIVDLFGSTDLFFNSVFCAQNSVRMSGMKPAELKALFVEFLGDRLNKYVEYENTAKQCGNVLVGRIASVEKEIERLNEKLAGYKDLNRSLQHTNSELAGATEELSKLESGIKTLNADLEKAKEKQAENKVIETRLADIKKRKSETMDEIGSMTGRKEKELSSIREQAKAVSHDLANINLLLNDSEKILKAAKDEKDMSRKLIGLEEDYENKSNQLDRANAELEALKKDHERNNEAETEILNRNTVLSGTIAEALRKNSDNADRVRDEINRLATDPDLKNLEYRIETEQAKLADLDKRGTDLRSPDNPHQCFDCNSENCGFIQTALEAKKIIPELEKKANERRSEIERQKKEFQKRAVEFVVKIAGLEKDAMSARKNLNEKAAEYSRTKEERQSKIKDQSDRAAALKKESDMYRKDIRDTRAIISDLQVMTAKLSEIKVANARKADLEKKKTELIDKGVELKDSWDLTILTKRNSFDQLDKLYLQTAEAIDDTVDAKIPDLQREIESTTNKISEKNNAVSRLNAEIASIEKQIEDSKKFVSDLSVLENERRRLTHDLADWNYLQIACGANGLRALEIDSVAPSITCDANRLLEHAFGTWAMVDFRTQDENGREVLEPRVIDQDGDSVLVGNRSGGQQTWAMKALRLAMTLVSKEKSGRDYRTAYADEDDAGLDVETAKSFTMLYKAFMDIGGFSKCFYISHKPESVLMADHIIQFQPGVISIQ